MRISLVGSPSKFWQALGLVLAWVALCCVPAHGQATAQRSTVFNAVAADTAISLINTTVGSHKIYWRVTGTVSACTVALDSSSDGASFSAGGIIAGQTCTSNGSSAIATGNFNFARINVTAFTGTGTVTIVYAGESDLPAGTVTSSPAASTPADATSNTGVPGFQAYNMIWNGATWDRWKGITGQTGLAAVGVVNSGSNPADGTSQMFTELNNAGNSQLTARGVGYVFNNSTYDRIRSGDTANLTSRTGSQLTAAVAIDPCQSSAVVKTSVAINITSATTTQLVAPSGSTAVYVCGFDFTISEVVTTANTLQFTTGTGATCGGATVTKSGLYGAGGVTAGDPIHIQSGGAGTVFQAAASSGVCVVTAIGATGSFQGILTFIQQ